ncbi:golgin subfamily B member 1 isoform X2 [Cylas formicarius]|uniref:golgin subfamily B member 1 isoform X2 n=1 Tax=Cylas formicarius TaxID=197179 RepID=UPI002958BD9B|nr:golgin subfamily B member 1 isoform X2 [Cylas formicarius]
MWNEPDPDPGGQKDSLTELSPQELSDLKDQNEQQLLLIAQLKEMLRKEQSSVTQEKVEEYVNTLSRAKAKKSRLKLENSAASGSGRPTSAVSIDASKKERINLLRQQLEENKAKLAERSKSQKGIEEMVTQLQAQLKESQQYIPLNVSLSETKIVDYNENTSQKELYNILLTKEKKIAELTAKSQKLEENVLDLQENLKEKDSVIDARTKAITLMTDSLSKKGKTTLDALEETKEQMRKMQEDFVTLEGEMKARQLSLLNDLKVKNFEIGDLERIIKQLENENVELKLIQSDFDNKVQMEIEKRTAQSSELPLAISFSEKETLTEDQIFKELQKIKHKNVELLENILERGKNLLENRKEDAQKKLSNENEKLIKENTEYSQKISELEKQLKEALSDLNILRNTSSGSSVKEIEVNSELEKLKKQLEESNKSMIKMRAQHKSKLKELNKKLDQFKKMNDANALITQLQNENTKLSERIAELEEEKGNMQLKMVESTGSSKDSSELEDAVKNLEETVSRIKDEVTEKDKVVEILESEVLSLKKELNMKNEEFSSQVSSELSSIYYEEQLEKLQAEKKAIMAEMISLKLRNEELLEKVEVLKNEKQEINSKLDSYIQENMELIDKLEKLSAEKVSSAESIEMVEGLTQQEKLELAAYQKDLNSEETIKCTEDDSLEPPVELNESVLQLSEDTAELLQKIEMFTQERKEVMQKMETLKDENNSLNLKIKEIECNRDVLEETYEQLQNEKEALINEKRELILKLDNIPAESHESSTESLGVLQMKLSDLQNQYESLLNENDELKQNLRNLNSQMQEKYNLENILIKMEEQNGNLELKLKSAIEEANTYQQTIQENKNEIANYSQLVVDLEVKLRDSEKEIEKLNLAIADLSGVISELQSKNSNYETMLSELDQLKSTLGSQMEQARDYELELNQNGDTISRLNGELIEMNRKMLKSQNDLEMRASEIKQLKNELDNKEEFIKNLQSSINEKDKHFKIVSEDIKGKYLGLQKQLDNNGELMQRQVADLNQKNKEQLEKMKKIAANLKKKTQAYQELQEQYSNEKEKWESEGKEKNNVITNYEKSVEILQQQLQTAIDHKEVLEKELGTLQARIEETDRNYVDLQNYILDIKQKEQKVHEISLLQEMSASLHERPHNESASSEMIQEEKVKELEMLLETKESELVLYKDRVAKLEENIRNLEEEKHKLEMGNVNLEEQLNLALSNLKEKALVEEQLASKLTEVDANNKAVEKQLESTVLELQTLKKKYNENEELSKKLKIKLKKAHDKVNELKLMESNVEELQAANEELKKHVAALEANQKHIQNENETLQKRNMSDYEKIEADYQIQLEELLRAKNELTIECEKLQERLKEVQDKEEEFIMEIEEYKIRLHENDSANIDEINKLRGELETASVKLQESVYKIDELNTQIDVLKGEIALLRERRASLDEVMRKPTESDAIVSASTQTCENDNKIISPLKAEHSQNIPTFNWFNQDDINDRNDIFGALPSQQIRQTVNVVKPSTSQNVDYITDARSKSGGTKTLTQATNVAHSAVVENNQEALLKKIKALEFLLYNVDKENEEKEDALSQCADLVTELTKLFSENENVSENSNAAVISLESQVLSQSDVERISKERGQLEEMEFTPMRPDFGIHSMPIVEETIEPKKAYLCYSKDHQKEGQELSAIESQVLSASQLDQIKSDKKVLQKIEFAEVGELMGEQQQPVIEPLVQPDHAYICQTKDDNAHSLEAFQENDDGWGWGPEEARLEEEHMVGNQHTHQVANLQLEVHQLQDTLKILQVERENHLEEIKQLQIKSGKLIKKCKELKIKCDQAGSLRHQDDGSFFDLNETIQEELKTQVLKLEKKITETSTELDREKLEKAELLKKIDVLTTAHEKMIEMKEIQDTEVLRWRRKYQEAVEKLQQQEWDNNDFTDIKKPVVDAEVSANYKVEELERTITDLTLDNDELQALLEEQKKLRLEAEKARNSVDETQELSKLKETNDNLSRQIEDLTNQNTWLAKAKEELIEKEVMIQKLQEQVAEQRSLLDVSANMQKTIEDLNNEKVEREKVVAQLSEDIRTKIESEGMLTEKLHMLNQQIEQKDSNINSLKTSLNETKNVQTIWEATEIQLRNAIIEKESELATIRSEKETKDMQNQQLLEQLQNNEENRNLLTQLAAKDKEIAELVAEKELMNQEIQKISNQLEKIKEKEFEERLENIVSELNLNWQAQVDQRGEDVAERWKAHLELVQNDFSSIQAKLATDLSKVEERCNVLINENNELRRNVDAEIRNEVDKISALQQQISSSQQSIISLNADLQQKQHEIEDLKKKLLNYSSFESELNSLREHVEEKDRQLNSIVIETKQRQFDEKREVVEEIVSLLEKHSVTPLSYDKQDIVNEFRRQLDLMDGKDAEISQLRNALADINAKKDREIIGLNHVIEDLEKEVVLLHEKDAEIVRLTSSIENITEEKVAVEQELIKTQHEISNLQVVLNEYKEKHDNDARENLKLLETLKEKDNQLDQLKYRLNQIQETNDNNKEVERLNFEIAQGRQDWEALKQYVSEYQTQLSTMQQQMAKKSQEMEVIRQQISVYQQTINSKDEEIRSLQNALADKEMEYNISMEHIQNRQRQYEELLSSSQEEIAKLQKSLENNKNQQEQHLQNQKLLSEKDALNTNLQVQINEKAAMIKELEEKLFEQSKLVDEDTKQLEELKLIIEDQVVKIEELKKQLFDVSNQYDSLIAEMDMRRPSAVTQQPSSSSVVNQPAPKKTHVYEDDPTEPVSRAELDIALYMLHQRDVRCEELTVELTQLLEERDTLQLRLSNAIREKEELRRRLPGSSASSQEQDPSSIHKSKSSEIFLAATGTELAREPLESDTHLASKLSELKNIGYKKDKTFVDEQELRQRQQLAIMQQHINEASKLPPEAAAKLVDATYTLSRDVQSPSKVLLNWLWGNSTPKANES